MKAVVYARYGLPDVLRFTDVEKPAPKDNEVLVKVHAVSLNASDWEVLRGKPLYSRIMGPFRPRRHILGSDIAGQVDVAGRNATIFQPGDEVFADILSYMGGFADYVCVPESALARIPAGMSYEEAAALPQAGAIALQGIRDKGQVQPGQKVLIVGASGGVGTFAVQIAKALGADVTGVCSTRNVEMVRSLGADHVIDYTRSDFTRSGQKYDLIFQLAGTHSPSDCRRALTPKGTLVLSSGESDGRWIGPVDRMIRAAVLSPFVSQKLGSFLAKPTQEDLQLLKELVETGKVKPVIDRTYSLSEVPEAIRYLEEGHARGKVVVTV